MSKSKIEWTEVTWNPVVGCSKVSPGCDNCYAERMAATRLKYLPRYAGITENGRWSGEVRVIESEFEKPMRWYKPRMIFVCSMSDIMHHEVPEAAIERIFGEMCNWNCHTYQVLTKRPERLLQLQRDGIIPDPLPPHIWIGTSVENQKFADKRIPVLTQINAGVRFLSCEPLLGPVWNTLVGIHWVIVGGESGPKARQMHPDWARSLRDQCVEAGVPFFFKQWGGVNKKKAGRLLDGREWNHIPEKGVGNE
jgi:protein gp37